MRWFTQRSRGTHSIAVVVLVLLSASLLARSDAGTTSAAGRPGAASAPDTLPTAGTTIRDAKAFGHALTMLGAGEFMRMVQGKRVFSRVWLDDGGGAAAGQGLGPLFNATSCVDCHSRDGRGGAEGVPPVTIFRVSQHELSSVAGSPDAAPYADAMRAWGPQLQDRATEGQPEGRVETSFTEVHGRYADGVRYSLRRPEHRLVGFPHTASRVLAPRIPTTLIGVGLLEAVDEATILSWADPQDADRDGISGRASIVERDGEQRLGRFGWKAAQPGLPEQVAGALAEDMGIVSEGHADSITAPEISRGEFSDLLTYLRLLAPPPPRADHPLFDRGRDVFDEIGCGGCHRASLQTRGASRRQGGDKLPEAVLDRAIEPYSDLLLHDLGVALADGDGSTTAAREWRTAPLWGLGLMEQVNGRLLLLHDGRARSFAEAILWHGGEAEASRERFRQLDRSDRNALVSFLESI